MVFVMLTLAIGLSLASYFSTDRGIKVFLGICAILNVLACAHAVYVDHPYAFKLMPNEAAQY